MKWNSVKFTFLRHSVIRNNLVPDVFNYADSKVKSWHRAQKIQEEYSWTTNRPRHFLSLLKIVVFFIGALRVYYTININLKNLLGTENFLKIMFEKFRSLTRHRRAML